MPFDNIVAVALIMGLFGLAILVLLWPGEKQGRKVLRRWGVDDPSPSDVAEAVRYLRRRRFWYPWLFLGLPLLADVAGLRGDTTAFFLATLLIGALIAEVLAQRPRRSARREAGLDRRAVSGLIPVWGLVIYAAIVVAAVVWLIIHGWWALLGIAAAVSVVTWLVILLAVRRPSTGDGAADGALRVRSARVAAGLGLAATVTLAIPEVTNLGSWLLVVAGFAGWYHLAHRSRAEVARCR
ncbi:AcrR family transcriptional regulator [Amycolatopsis umgeniensis]|uniref:AcrR family transcriptional regulator n=1 Tax=Amycolatopsis umgeniensis TaxID=336628 RepID=A0A841B662_9PSEU|nr:AcrR family transcriptional regulator [Amycolatopsis umgeniensis]